jgi:uncharacterized RDD family membrane protein YckC
MASVNTRPDGGPPRGAAAGGGPDYAVLTPERVTLQYDVAGIGSRSAAALIDVAIQAVVVVVVSLPVIGFFSLFSPPRNGGGPGPWLVFSLLALLVVGLFVVLFGYYVFFEIVWNGQTPGKRALGLRVLRENGYPVRPGDAVVRNLVRVVDGPPFGTVIGLAVMLLNGQARRLGDFAAGTIVVREGTRRGVAALSAPGTLGATPAAADGAPILSPSDATLVRDFLVRRNELAPRARERLAGRLADTLAGRYGLQAPRAGSSPEVFLERLADR